MPPASQPSSLASRLLLALLSTPPKMELGPQAMVMMPQAELMKIAKDARSLATQCEKALQKPVLLPPHYEKERVEKHKIRQEAKLVSLM